MIQLKLTDIDRKIRLEKKKKYIIYFDGVYYASNKGNFHIEIKNTETNEQIAVNVPFLKRTEYTPFHGRIQYAYAYITKPGDYIINFKNIDDLKLSNSPIWPLWFILPSNIKPDKVLIEIG